MDFVFNSSMEHFVILLIMGMSMFGFSMGVNHKPPIVYNIMDFGAAGDGKKDDSQAILMGWKAICTSSKVNDSSLIIPKGTFLVTHAIFRGPCKPKTINLQIKGDIVAPNTPTKHRDSWLTFSKVNGLHINGNGKINGRGSVWWKKYEKTSQRPIALRFEECNNLRLQGTTHINSPKNHISIRQCNGVTISDLHIHAPDESPNTDGIGISASTHVNVRDCIIGTGDDCVAIVGGSYDVNITRVACGPGHGISIGSLGKNGSHSTVEKIRVINCSFTGTQNGARIKTWQGGSGYARNILFKDITLENAGNPILIDQYYCPDDHNCKNQTAAVEVSNVTFKNVKGTSKDKTAINLSCSESVPCKDIVVTGAKITNSDATKQSRSYCLNAYGEFKDNVPPLGHCILSGR